MYNLEMLGRPAIYEGMYNLVMLGRPAISEGMYNMVMLYMAICMIWQTLADPQLMEVCIIIL